MYKAILNLLLISLNVSGIVHIQQNSISQNQAEETYYQQEDNARITYMQLFQKTSLLGFDNLMTSWTFLDFIQYYGDAPARDVTGYDLSPLYFETIVKRDPKFISAYPFLEPATTIFALQPDKSNQIIAQGLENLSPSIPYTPEILIMKATNEILFLADIAEATKTYRQALQWAREDTNNIYSNDQIQRLQQTIKFLESNPDPSLVTASSWAGLLMRAKDEKTQQRILDYLDELGAEVTLTENRVSVKMKEE
ncbi:hypothetical protein IQ215_01010 [Cyanobacterium stanieri LEGE 03274]|uniref:Uncharacterized protein n=1 Tax=Cyanobacterium stanieri LEGE 03274 TaxID=1828756 RepID=A0ABR9V131_9CHRO|nr:hypothetical protein [Cyanobacterium stanieri]MBE9221266.1 hypothetical protein [Cyanobacterium stanieri LEGE 03274]